MNHYIFIACLLCFLCDVILICVGTFGVGEIFAKNQILAPTLALCSVCFALYYVFLSLRAVLVNPIKLQLAKENPPPLEKVIISTLLTILANPHAYLDTIFLVGSAALNFFSDEKILFVLGALNASFLWLLSLGYGAKFLSSYIKPNIVEIIDLFACLIVYTVAYSLILYISERI